MFYVKLEKHPENTQEELLANPFSKRDNYIDFFFY